MTGPTRFSRARSTTAVLGLLLLAAGCDSPTGDDADETLRILYRSERGGVPQWYLTSTDGARQAQHPWLPNDAVHAAWSPDGSRVAFTRGQPWNVFVANENGSGPAQVYAGAGDVALAAWSPSGARLAVWHSSGPSTWGIALVNPDGTAMQVPAGGAYATTAPPSWSPDGTRIVFAKDETRPNPNGSDFVWTRSLFVLDVASGASTRLTTGVCGDAEADWSPDGARIAFAQCSGAPGERRKNLFLINPDGTGLQRLTDGAWMDGYPAWSPDGRHIAFESTRAGNYDVWIMRADGSQPRNLTADHAGHDYEPRWDPAPDAE